MRRCKYVGYMKQAWHNSDMCPKHIQSSSKHMQSRRAVTEIDIEIMRIEAMTDEEVLAEHLRLYGGNKKLADKSIEMMQARVEAVIAKTIKQ